MVVPLMAFNSVREHCRASGLLKMMPEDEDDDALLVVLGSSCWFDFECSGAEAKDRAATSERKEVTAA